jgi:hypothetical protein
MPYLPLSECFFAQNVVKIPRKQALGPVRFEVAMPRPLPCSCHAGSLPFAFALTQHQNRMAFFFSIIFGRTLGLQNWLLNGPINRMMQSDWLHK